MNDEGDRTEPMLCTLCTQNYTSFWRVCRTICHAIVATRSELAATAQLRHVEKQLATNQHLLQATAVAYR